MITGSSQGNDLRFEPETSRAETRFRRQARRRRVNNLGEGEAPAMAERTLR